MNPLRIALVVQGRFHMFDLGRELIRMGHQVNLFTNYPPKIVTSFGIPAENVRSFVAHRYVSGIVNRVFRKGLDGRCERWMNTAFGRWAAGSVDRERRAFDVVACMSGIAEETLDQLTATGTLRVLHRGSSHIRVQRRILDEEVARTGVWIDRPSDWIIAREEREYAMADRIVVLSPFARDSFLEMGVPAHKLSVIQPGVEIEKFQATPKVIEERCRRVLRNERLRLLCVGTFCLRKGAAVWEEFFRSPDAKRFEVRFVGPISTDAVAISNRLREHAEFRAKVAHYDLWREYEWGDVFVFPTLEEGFPAVVNQAQASGLPIVATTVCRRSRDDWNGLCGWSVATRDTAALMNRLSQLDANREAVANAARAAAATRVSNLWSDTAEEYVSGIVRSLPPEQ